MVVAMLDIDPLTPEGMVITAVLIGITYLVIVTGGGTLILGSVLLILAAFVVYIAIIRIYRWAIGVSSGGRSQ